MRALNMQPVASHGDGGGKTLAEFDLQVTPDLRLNGMALRRTRDGVLVVYAPNARGRRAATFTSAFAASAVAAASDSYRELSANESRIRR